MSHLVKVHEDTPLRLQLRTCDSHVTYGTPDLVSSID